MKSVYLLTLLPFSLLINGCNDAETEVCRYYVQQDLDNSNFDSAINRLDDKSCQDSYPRNEYLVAQSNAYLGKAGLPLPTIIRTMINDENSTNSTPFKSFVRDITHSATPSVLTDLDKSRNALDDYLNSRLCKDITNPTSAENTVCLITGFVDILKTSMVIENLTGGMVDEWASSDNSEEQPALLRSSCALKYSYDHKMDSSITASSATPYLDCKPANEGNITVEDSTEVVFTSDIASKTYNQLTVSYAGTSEYFLESIELGSTVFTKGYCQTDYTVCDDISDICYACPISQSEDDLNVQDYLLDSLNSGFDSIESVIGSAGESGEILQSIEEFKDEIKPGGCSATPQGEDCFSLDDIIDYLNKD